MNIRNRFLRLRQVAALALAFASALLVSPVHAAALETASGQKIAFLGDSITAGGVASPGGYVRLIIKSLEGEGQKIGMIPAGVSGNTSKDMLGRLQASVLSKKPDWMTLSCGVNDVWHGPTGVELEPYKKNITSIVEQAQAAGIKVVILTSTMIGEDQKNPNNQKLIPYNDFLRSLAKEKHCLLADLNADMQAEVTASAGKVQGNVLTVDGVHMNALGNEMMAAGILKALGFSAAQLAKAKDSWNQIPDAAQIGVKAGLSVPQFLKLRDLAAKQKISIDDLVSKEVSKAVQALTEK